MENIKKKNELPKQELDQVAGGTYTISGLSDQSQQFILRRICPFCRGHLKDNGDLMCCSDCGSTFAW